MDQNHLNENEDQQNRKGYAYYIKGLAQLEFGDPDAALLMAEQAIKEDPEQSIYTHLRIVSLMALTEYESALVAIEDALQAHPEREVEFLELKGSALSEQSRYVDAIEVYTTLISLRPDMIEYRIKRIDIYAKLQDHKRALLDCAVAEAMEPENKGVLFRKGTLLIHLGRMEEVTEVMEQTLDWGGENSYLINERLSLYLGMKQYDRAVGYLDKLIDQEPENSVFYYMKHQILMDNKDYEASIDPIEKALELNPDDTDYLWMRAMNLYALDRIDETLADISVLIQKDPMKKEAYIFRCTINNRLKRYEESLADAQAAIKLAPDDGRLQIYLGCNLYFLGDYEDALATFDHAIEMGVKEGKIYHYKSLIYAKLEDMPKSRYYEVLGMQAGYHPDLKSEL